MPVAELAALATVGATARTGYEKIKEMKNNHLGIRSLNAFEQQFCKKMEKHITQSPHVGNSEIEMSTLLEDHREDIFAPLGTQNTRSAIVDDVFENICDTVADEVDSVSGTESSTPHDKKTLRDAVETAYREARDEYISTVDDDCQRLNLDLLRDIEDGMNQLVEELTYRPELVDDPPFDRVYLDRTESPLDRAQESLGKELGHTELSFAERDAQDRITDTTVEWQLILGCKGSGKTRTLYECIEGIVETSDVSEVVTLEGKIDRPGDLAPLTEGQGTGDLLLLWDDIHKNTDEDTVESVLRRLKEALGEADRTLYVRGTVRRRDIQSFLPDDLSLSSLDGRVDRGSKHETWQHFSTVELEQLNQDRIESILEQALEQFGLRAEPDVQEALVKKIHNSDPTPFYIVTFCQMQDQGYDTPVTLSDVEEFPDEAVNSWKKGYDSLSAPTEDILKSLLILDTLDAPLETKLVESIYTHAFNGERFSRKTETLETAGWLNAKKVRRGRDTIQIHDVRLEAVSVAAGKNDSEFDIANQHESLRKLFLYKSAENRTLQRRVTRYNDIWARMTTAYAELTTSEQLADFSTEDARKLHERAVEINNAIPTVQVNYAEFLKHDGKHKKASKQYERAIEHNPETIELYVEYTEYIRLHDVEQASEIYERGIEATDDSHLYREYAEFLKNRDDERAEEVYKDGIEATDNWRLYKDYAEFLENRDDERVEKVYKDGIEATGDPLLYKGYAEFLENRDDERAEEVYKDGIEATDDWHLYREYAEFLKNRDDERAEEVYKDGIEATDDWRLYSDYTDFLKNRDDERAEEVYKDRIEATGYFYSDYAEFLENRGEPERAEEVYKDGIEATGYLYREYAEFLENRGEPERAEEVYKDGIEATDDCRLYSDYTDFLKNRDDERAEEVYKDGIEATGDRFLYREYAEFLENRDDERAEEVYKDGIEATGSPLLYKDYAEFLENRGEPERAEEVYKDGIKATGDKLFGVKLYNDYAGFLQTRNPERADRIFNRVLLDHTGTQLSKVREGYALVLARLGETARACSEIDAVIELGGSDSDEIECSIESCDEQVTLGNFCTHLRTAHD